MRTHLVPRTTRLFAALAGLALLGVACSDSKQITSGSSASSTSVDGSSTTTSTADTTTTLAGTTTTVAATTLPPASTVVTSAPPLTPAPTSPPPGPTAPPAGGTALGAPTNLHATPAGGIVLDAAFYCDYEPAIPGWVVDDCKYMPSYNNGVVALVLRSAGDGHFAVAVMFQSGANLVQRYWADEEVAGGWSEVNIEVGDFHFDDGAEVWVGYRYSGSGGYLDVDVLDPLPGGVFFLGGIQSVSHGVARLHPGGLTLQTAVYADTDANCCPSSFLVQEVTWAANQWRISAGTTYPAASVPPLTGNL